jgi:SAM-dependent methyltransferase
VKLIDLVRRSQPPIPWQEGDNIPWNDPGFSERMLAEHLNQSHDHASRRSMIIDEHVGWIHEILLQQQPSHILDLGCGPGLYSNRLATMGHVCTGIDYSPASFAYAKAQAEQAGLNATYVHGDIRTVPYGCGYDLAMLIYGELNVFSRPDAMAILKKAHSALRPGALLLLEAHTLEPLIPVTHRSHTWYSSEGGLFSPLPHLVLIEEHWDEQISILTRRYYVLDAAGGETTRYAQSMQGYTPAGYGQLLAESGFDLAGIEILPGIAHERMTPAPQFCAIVARKAL